MVTLIPGKTCLFPSHFPTPVWYSIDIFCKYPIALFLASSLSYKSSAIKTVFHVPDAPFELSSQVLPPPTFTGISESPALPVIPSQLFSSQPAKVQPDSCSFRFSLYLNEIRLFPHSNITSSLLTVTSSFMYTVSSYPYTVLPYFLAVCKRYS